MNSCSWFSRAWVWVETQLSVFSSWESIGVWGAVTSGFCFFFFFCCFSTLVSMVAWLAWFSFPGLHSKQWCFCLFPGFSSSAEFRLAQEKYHQIRVVWQLVFSKSEASTHSSLVFTQPPIPLPTESPSPLHILCRCACCSQPRMSPLQPPPPW